ncbi:ParB/RepB/Spo0J family partition protein [Candidatus Eisenbacteria bacterium]|uniref:ParB/RepB/Spo0J family partition protein n=1 Tax=Eiseniibacteriota bacterium TaxID=2212470 RepID=A0ABV6YM32_UNCEI
MEHRQPDEKSASDQMIPLDDLTPHPLNANIMSDDLRAKLTAHIRRTGRYPHLIVRPHTKDEDQYQVLDGHHRLAILRDLGHTEARCDIWQVDDREAQLLLATLNRLEGQDLPIRRAQLVHELLGSMSIDDLAGLLPETDRQIEELHALLEFPAEEIADLLDAEAEEEEKVLPRVISFVVTADQEKLIEEAVELASDGRSGRDRRARGLLNLAKRFMEDRDGQVTHEDS